MSALAAKVFGSGFAATTRFDSRPIAISGRGRIKSGPPNGGPMYRIAWACVLVILLLWLIQPVSARPEFLSRFQADPFRKAEVDGCATCHVNPRGGGPRNEFGQAFGGGGQIITPMLRANFPENFKFETAKLADGSMFYFSDPENKFVVFERAKQKTLIDLTTLSAKPEATKEAAPIPPAANRMTFFVTSKGVGNGGHLGGLAGADRQCQALAEAAGAGDRIWRAYLSTSFQDKPAINAGDRIGTGPWFNSKGLLVARGVADLHSSNRITKDNALDEKGQPIADANRQAILTGTQANGTAAVGMNCNNWSSPTDGKAVVGSLGGGWNSGSPSNGCSQQNLQETHSAGLFYCF